jgi:hypothetical protein
VTKAYFSISFLFLLILQTEYNDKHNFGLLVEPLIFNVHRVPTAPQHEQHPVPKEYGRMRLNLIYLP